MFSWEHWRGLIKSKGPESCPKPADHDTVHCNILSSKMWNHFGPDLHCNYQRVVSPIGVVWWWCYTWQKEYSTSAEKIAGRFVTSIFRVWKLIWARINPMLSISHTYVLNQRRKLETGTDHELQLPGLLIMSVNSVKRIEMKINHQKKRKTFTNVQV